MFSCSACLHRAVKNLFTGLPNPALVPTRPRRRSPPLGANHHLFYRSGSTIQSVRKGHHRRVLLKAFNSDRPIRPNNSSRGLPTKVVLRDTLARENNRHHLDINDGADTQRTRQQLQWLQDPVKLASAVLERLRIGDDKGAIDLIRGSEKSLHGRGEESGSPVSNIVSWNHLMDWNMHKGDTREAKKVYNEMKKRGHRPDAHTYTIMLRGFAANVNKPNAVTDAVSVYNSIFAPNSIVKPNTIHSNAIIKVCAKGGDMDNLWAVAGTLPERGTGAADNWTYTSILNAVTADAEKRASDLRATDDTAAASENVIEEAIRDGEKLWEDIAKKWRAGNLTIDERLTCAMGRLLLLSPVPGHWNKVFTLVEQTMRIPTWKSKSEFSTSTAVEKQEQAGVEGMEGNQDDAETSAPTNFSPVPSGGRQPDSLTKPSTFLYASPGSNTLSMLLQAAILTRSFGAGKYYWETLTNFEGAYRVQYDLDNLSQYLRLLRLSRSSKAVAELLSQAFTEENAAAFLKRGIFVIAMSTCVRDKDNPSVFEHSTDIFERMQERLGQPDAKIMQMYVELAVLTTPGLGYTEGKFEPHPTKNNAMNALARLAPSAMNVRSMIKEKIDDEEFDGLSGRRKKAAEKLRRHGPERVHQPKEVLAAFLSSLISAYDKLLSKKELPESFRQQYLLQRRNVAAFVTKMLAPPPRRTDTRGFYGENHSDELDQQEERLVNRARGFKGPKRFHDRTDEFMRDETRKWEREGRKGRTPWLSSSSTTTEEFESSTNPPFPAYQHAGQRRSSFQKGWGGEFEELARKEKGVKTDFANISA